MSNTTHSSRKIQPTDPRRSLQPAGGTDASFPAITLTFHPPRMNKASMMFFFFSPCLIGCKFWIWPNKHWQRWPDWEKTNILAQNPGCICCHCCVNGGDGNTWIPGKTTCQVLELPQSQWQHSYEVKMMCSCHQCRDILSNPWWLVENNISNFGVTDFKIWKHFHGCFDCKEWVKHLHLRFFFTRWWFQDVSSNFYFHHYLRRNDPIWRAYFSDGLKLNHQLV